MKMPDSFYSPHCVSGFSPVKWRSYDNTDLIDLLKSLVEFMHIKNLGYTVKVAYMDCYHD